MTAIDLRQALAVVVRRWWLIVALPLAVFTGSLAVTANSPYLATVRATILIPGDTESPGNAERPELMVLDDAPTLVDSQVFADATIARLQSVGPGLGLDADDVAGALSASRVSRVLTIEARHEQRQAALAIAVGAASILPDAINTYLIATNAPPATVRIIDPPTEAERDYRNRALIVALQTAVALVVAVGLAFLAASLDGRLHSAAEVEAALGLPVLADARPRRRVHHV